MANFMQTLEAKSDQLNATDIMGIDLTIRIRDAVLTGNREQPLSIYFDGDNNRPWKPSKGMRRVLAAGWGADTENLIGKSVKLHFDQSVKYAGKEVGGIRIKGMSDIDQRGIVVVEAINRQQRVPVHVEYVSTEQPDYPADKFAKGLPAMTKKMHLGEMTLQQVIAKCQQTGKLTAQQIKALEDAAPVIVDPDDDAPSFDEPVTLDPRVQPLIDSLSDCYDAPALKEWRGKASVFAEGTPERAELSAALAKRKAFLESQTTGN